MMFENGKVRQLCSAVDARIAVDHGSEDWFETLNKAHWHEKRNQVRQILLCRAIFRLPKGLE